MRVFRTIDEVREHVERSARNARMAQDKYHRALVRLNDGMSESEIGRQLGFRPGGKTACREQIMERRRCPRIRGRA